MIERYTRDEMGEIWKSDVRFQKMLEVEMAVAQAQADLGIIPRRAAQSIKNRGRFDLPGISKIEKTVKHDVIAFVSNVAGYVGQDGKFLHFGMTSSDVLDTALSLQVRDAGVCLVKTLSELKKELRSQAKKHRATLCSGRTHGMHAEPTSFGYKLMGHLKELERNEDRVKRSLKQMAVCKLSGAVGTYSTQPLELEKKVAKLLKLTPESVATQVIPRDRHAELILSLSLLAAGVERLAVELRHLQRTEVGEVAEGFAPGQKGSSAMPHKKNPISAENITGLSRLIRSYCSAALENVVLWHERDISHSSVERVMFPDVFILADYILARMADLVRGMYVDKKRMQQNMESSQGQIYSSHVLLDLVRKGLTREEAYALVQRISHDLRPGQRLQDRLISDAELRARNLVGRDGFEEIFSGRTHLKRIHLAWKRVSH